MKILLINKFLYPKGGDAISTLTTGKILESHGHEVVFWGMGHPDNPAYPFADFFVSSVDYDTSGGLYSKARAAMNILYSFEARKKMAEGGLLNKVIFPGRQEDVESIMPIRLTQVRLIPQDSRDHRPDHRMGIRTPLGPPDTLQMASKGVSLRKRS